MITKLDRYRGALVGVLAGDALLAPYETWSSEQIAADLEKRGGLVPFDYPNPWIKEGATMPMGRPTDDSDQTAALAESLIACHGLDEEDLFNRLRNVIFGHVSPLWDGKAVGAGRTTREALRPETYAESKARPPGNDYPSNGSLMRAAPLALYFGHEATYDPKIVQRMSFVTHRHGVAFVQVCIYVRHLTILLERGSTNEIVSNGFTYAGTPAPEDPGKWPERGNVELTLRIALWALLNATDFRDGLTKVALIGGDTDTYGAVAGGLLGATFGIDGIPDEWQKVLKGRDTMIEYADALYEMAHR